MKIVVAPDSFKESLTAVQVCHYVAAGLRDVCPQAEVIEVPLADGGEGTVEALVAATGGRLCTRVVCGPRGRPVEARFGLLGDGRTAVVEMAAASGLPLLAPEERDPWVTTTYGTGELIRAALEQGARRIIVGIGGSATNDLGAGMAQALGIRLLDEQGRDLGPGGGQLGRLARIDPTGRLPALAEASIVVACDVDNPLVGPQGASAVYGPQKGATADMVARLDAHLRHAAGIIRRDLGVEVTDLPGAGAAGGLGAGLVAFCQAQLKRGIDLVLEAVDLAGRLQGADLCLTGEGTLDASTCFGKTAVGVARVAARLGVPVVVLAGAIGPGAEQVLGQGVAAYASICDGPMTLQQAMREAGPLLRRAAAGLVRLLRLGGRMHWP